ncbi:hypothetical protein [Victivallis vadensis]|uniref:hypothetical protein n=1 Tax=Victivallis vadensis TaxID=172901 RepID=UPI0023F74F74|nr:hypothetical protein [Victivallis vadensis]
MKIPVTKEILKAMQEASEAYGSQNELSKQCGVNHTTVNNIMNNGTKSITSAIWEKLEPALRPYLPGDVVNAGVIGSGRIYGPVIGKAGSVVQRHAGASPEELAANRSATLDEVLDAVMESDIDDAAKIRFYGILKQLKQERK